MNIGTAMLNGELNYTDKLVDIIYDCQMCGACGVSCNYAMDMEVQEPINEMRIKAVQDGKTRPALDKVLRGLRKDGAMVPVTGKRGAWASGLKLTDATKSKVEVVYHVGCLTSYDPKMQKLAKATAKILQKAGVDFGIAGDNETCCGGRAYQMGYEKDFLKQAKKNMAMLQKAGAKTVVTSCADGYQAFKVLYDKYKLKGDLEVLHISEFIARLLQEGRLKLRKKVDLAVTYHDPCRLAVWANRGFTGKGRRSGRPVCI
jgi:Fe-S oxidoreductase